MHAIDFVALRRPSAMAEAIGMLIEGRETSIEAYAAANARVPICSRAAPGHRRHALLHRRRTRRQRTPQADREIRRGERLDMALTGSNLAIWDWDLVNNEVTFSVEIGEHPCAKVTDKPGIVFSGVEVID